jgi:hypothetical protein
MKQTDRGLVEELGPMEKEYQTEPKTVFIRVLYLLSSGFSAAMLILLLTGEFSRLVYGNPNVWMGFMFCSLFAMIFATIASYLWIKKWFARPPTYFAVHKEGFTYRRFSNSKLHKARWENVTEIRVVQLKPNYYTILPDGRKEYKMMDMNYLVKLNDGKRFDLISLKDSKDILTTVIAKAKNASYREIQKG